MSRGTPSIRSRLANTLTIWSVVWGLAVAAAIWLVATHEMDELLDDTLQASAELMSAVAENADPHALASSIVGPRADEAVQRFAWQVVAADGTLLLRSERAPSKPWCTTATAGFSDVPEFRLFGTTLGSDGRMLYAAQTRDERLEARIEVALVATLAALSVGLLGHVWLRSRVRAEMQPLERLSDRLSTWNVDAPPPAGGIAFGAPERQELAPVHAALEALTVSLAARIANEQAFSAQAAHALRTPLAGIDAQLAVALRDAPPELTERLQRVRGGAARLQGVVASLLGLFRTGAEAQRVMVDVQSLLSRLPAPGLEVQVQPDLVLRADADLLAAALVNLLDNARRHGAFRVWVEALERGGLRVRDDGPGMSATQRARLQSALDHQRYEDSTGLGLMLVDRVARVHQGRLRLPACDEGFIAELELG